MNPRQFCSKVFSCWQCNFPKLQFLHILEYCGMQGKYENRVKNDNKFFLEIPGLLSSKTEQEKSK